MEKQENTSGQHTFNIQVPSTGNITSRRSLMPVLFAAVIFFFFFNFFTVSCGGQKVGSVTGINLLTGTELVAHDVFPDFYHHEMFSDYYEEIEGQKSPPSAWAIIAFGAAIIGLSTLFFKGKRGALIGAVAGAIGFSSLLILQFAIKSSIEKEGQGIMQAEFHFAYWGALIAMGIAGILNGLRMQDTHNTVVSGMTFKSITKPSFCSHCGAKVSSDYTFCGECGHSLK